MHAPGATKAARPSPDLESFLEDALPPEPVPGKPVLLLHARGSHRERCKRPSEAAALDHVLASQGFMPSLACPELDLARPVTFRLPRNVPWTHYPLVGGPYWRMGQIHLESRRGEELAFVLPAPKRDASDQALLLMRSTPDWLVPSDMGEDEFAQVVLLRDLAGAGTSRIRAWDGTALLDVPERIEAAKARLESTRPFDRFLWSYRANFLALGARALLAAGVHGNALMAGSKGWDAEAWSVRSENRLSVLADPWSVQMLFAVRRFEQDRWEGLAPAPVPFGVPGVSGDSRESEIARHIPGDMRRQMLHTAFPFFQDEEWRAEEKRRRESVAHNPRLTSWYREACPLYPGRQVFSWPGTGRYQRFDILKSPRPGWHHETYANLAIAVFDDLGLVECSVRISAHVHPHDRHAVEFCSPRLTEIGNRFVDMLPKSMEDPDLMLRWRTGPGGLPLETDIPAMDRWISSAFRKLKQTLNRLPQHADPEAAAGG